MDGVDQLANLLATVKSDGWDAAFDSDILYGGHISGDVENVKFQAYREPLRSMRHSLEDAKLCMAALNNIKARLANKIRKLQKRSAPLVLEDGIERIPNEVLAHIFDVGHQMEEQSELALAVSHVSRRFRQVSLQTPSLWTRLSSEHHDDQTETLISRSGQLGLHVTLKYHFDEKLRSSLRLLTPHSDRWSSLSLLNHHDDKNIMEEVGLTYFPRLRYIHHEFNVHPKSSQWNMPVLSQFYGNCSDFPSGVSIPFLSQLTCVELRFEYQDGFDLMSFSQALYSMVKLRSLALECQAIRTLNINFIRPLSAPEPHSFPIESLKLTFRNIVGHDLVKSFFDILAYLTASVVDVSLLTWGDPEDLLKYANFPYGSTMILRTALPFHLVVILEELLKNCPIICSVQFEISSFDCEQYMRPKWSHSTSLRHLRFHNCVMLDEKFVKTLAEDILSREDFQSLEFVSCHEISEGFLMDLQDELGERLKWSF